MRGGVRPAPAPTPAKIKPFAMPRSRTGIQRATNWLPAGYITASPAPRRNRTAKQEQSAPLIFSGNQCGERGKNSPPDHSCREYASWAKPIREFTADRLKQCVSGDQGTKYLSQLDVSQMVGINNRSARNRNVDAIEIRHCTQDKEPEDQKPAHSGCCRGRHGYDIAS